MSEIHKDFLKNKDDLEEIVAGHNHSLKSVLWEVDHHPNFNTVNRDSVKYHFTEMMSTYTYNPTQATVKSIINTDAIEIIRDDRLRRLLLMWADEFEDYSEEEQQLINHFAPYIIKHSNFNWFSPFDDISEKDKLTNLDSQEFYNYLIGRKIILTIITSDNEELTQIQNIIDEIIQLTDQT